MRRLIREPLVHFLVLGGLVLAVQHLLVPPEPLPYDATPIRITAADIERLRREWVRETGRTPTAAELRASIEHHIDEIVLLREALRLELDLRDAVARERLLRNLRFAFPQRRASDATLLHEARALGMSMQDPVVRRRLVQMMERRLTATVPYDEAALRRHLAAESHRAGLAGLRYRFHHVFLSADHAYADAHAAAQELRARLNEGTVTAREAGDPFLHGDVFDSLSEQEIAARFGTGFATALAQVPTGRWSGPLVSPYGLHLVYVEARLPAVADNGAAQQAPVVSAWIEQQRMAVLRARLARLRAHYRIEVAPLDTIAHQT